MGVVGDRFLLTLRGESVTNAQAIQNVFAYELTAGAGSCVDLNTVWVTTVLISVQNITSTGFIINDISTVNLDDPSDFDIHSIGSAGIKVGDQMPSFVAFEFEYQRATRAVNNGRKAFGLVAESTVSNGGADAGIITDLNILAGQLESPIISLAPAATWTPRIFRRPGTYASGVTPPPGAMFPISGVQYRRVSTQNTRKTGRGI
jgi:hypothetical protein